MRAGYLACNESHQLATNPQDHMAPTHALEIATNSIEQVSATKVSRTNLLKADRNGFEVISMLKELKKSKLLVLESHCAVNKFFVQYYIV